MTPELKPCPFCGSEASIEGQGWHAGVHTIISVTCSNHECILSGPISPELWNRRTPDLTEALARLKALEDGVRFRAGQRWITAKEWADEIAAIRNLLTKGEK